MSRRIGILTSGGDCPGLNAAIRGVAKAAYQMFDCEIIGIEDGFKGLIHQNYKNMKKDDFSGILTRGGTILGTSRTPFKMMTVLEDDGIDKMKSMVNTYEKLKLDCIVALGGNGTHKNANLLVEEGLNVIGLPKTIDNDIWGTDVSFGFHSAVDIATEVVDRIHTTADSHDRVMLVELMGHKAGWLTLYAGIAGGADVILIPEIPYNIDAILGALNNRHSSGKNFSILAVAEGAMDEDEAKLTKKDFRKAREDMPFASVSYRLARQITEGLGLETRVTTPGHQQRGGSPSPYDRLLATRLGAQAAELIANNDYGKTVAIVNGKVQANSFADIAGKLRNVDMDGELVHSAKKIGVGFGNN